MDIQCTCNYENGLVVMIYTYFNIVIMAMMNFLHCGQLRHDRATPSRLDPLRHKQYFSYYIVLLWIYINYDITECERLTDALHNTFKFSTYINRCMLKTI